MKKTLMVVVLLLIGFLLFYLELPVINYGFTGFAVILILLSVGAGFGLMNVMQANKKVSVKFTSGSKIAFGAALLLFMYITILPLVTSAPVFWNQSYRELIGNVKPGDKMTNHIAPIAIEKVRVVDEELAYLLGEKILGSDPALGSKSELGEFFIQKVGDQLYWVAPLQHSGFFKWMNNKAGTEGYVMVSATNERDVKLV